jgi:Leucine-rich repeat (LRR) protein
MQYLKKLELGGNRISIIDGISNLINLMQLSLEDNAILHLRDFPDLKSLMEIYLGNNNITN